MNDTRNSRRTIEGIVTSDKMEKTITVEVVRTYRHPKYLKYMRVNKKFHAHDEKGEARIGDRVELMACRPMSKLKRWRLVRVVERGVVTAELGVDAALEGALGVKKKDGAA
ncbi:MAG: 30S ribosomal protein S17 [Planctomycetes bacterium]|nr:30S ribosomal protein S17 [Planctomycetota bacterium]